MRLPIRPLILLLAVSSAVACLSTEPPPTAGRAAAGDIHVSSDTALTGTAIRALTPNRPIGGATATDTPSSFPAGQTVIAASLNANTAIAGTAQAAAAASSTAVAATTASAVAAVAASQTARASATGRAVPGQT